LSLADQIVDLQSVERDQEQGHHGDAEDHGSESDVADQRSTA